MPRLLFVTNDAWFLVSHRLDLVRTMSDEGWHCSVLAKQDDTVAQIESVGAKFHSWPIAPRGKGPIAELRSLLHLAKVMRQYKPDVIHLITIKPVLYGGLLSRLMNVPGVVYAVSGLGTVFVGQSLLSRVIRALVSRLYKFAVQHPNSMIVFQNKDDRAMLLDRLGLSQERTCLIRGSGVDLSNFPQTAEPEGSVVVTLAARLLKDKGIPEFVEAAKIINAVTDSVSFKIAGDNAGAGNPAAFSRDEIKALKDVPSVSWLGHVGDIPSLFAASHIVVLPSHREGLPKVLVEAGAAGRAVVTTDVPGCRDAITPNVTGLLVPVKNAEQLAQAILTLVNDPKRRQDMGRAGRQLVEEQMQVSAIAAQHKKIYEQLLANKQP